MTHDTEQPRILFTEGSYQKCIEQCKEVLNRKPDAVFALKWAGKSLLALGEFDQAQRILIKAHQLEKTDPETVKDIGNCFLNKGNYEQAKRAYERSLDIQADYVPAIYNLAGIAQISGDYACAVRLFLKAVDLDKSLSEAWSGAAKCTLLMKQWDATISLCTKALKASNSHKGIYQLLGDAHRGKGEPYKALQAYKKESEISPEDPAPLISAANLLRGLNKAEDAVNLAAKALELRPGDDTILSNLGCILTDAQRYEEAEQCCRRSTVLNPTNAEAYGNLAIVLLAVGKIDEAINAIKEAISLDPGKAGFHTVLGSIYVALGNHDEAVKQQLKALHLNPLDQEAHTGLGCIQLAKGEFSQGWHEYSYRPQKPCLQNIPTWCRSRKETVLVIGEQGIGDQILYGSLIQEAQSYCENMILRVDKRLVPLFKRSFSGSIEIGSLDTPESASFCDSYIAMADLSRLFRNSLSDFSSCSWPYLSADLDKSCKLSTQLRGVTNKKIIGLSWRSAGKGYNNKSKSVSLEDLAMSLSSIDAELVSLQYDEHQSEIEALKTTHGICINTAEELDLYNDIDGAAALISACDKVVTVSNVTAHLAGALGKETHLLVSRSPNFCWGLESSKSPWYPSISLYRQSRDGDWSKALDQIAGVLTD